MRQQLSNYGLKLDHIPICCDNTSAINMSKNLILHSRTKHIEIRHHFLRDHVQKEDYKLEFVYYVNDCLFLDMYGSFYSFFMLLRCFLIFDVAKGGHKSVRYRVYLLKIFILLSNDCNFKEEWLYRKEIFFVHSFKWLSSSKRGRMWMYVYEGFDDAKM